MEHYHPGMGILPSPPTVPFIVSPKTKPKPRPLKHGMVRYVMAWCILIALTPAPPRRRSSEGIAKLTLGGKNPFVEAFPRAYLYMPDPVCMLMLSDALRRLLFYLDIYC